MSAHDSPYINITVTTNVTTIDTDKYVQLNHVHVFLSYSKIPDKTLKDNGYLLRQYKSIYTDKKQKLYVYVCIDKRVNANQQSVRCKVIPHKTYSEFYFYYNNMWSKLNIGSVSDTQTSFITLINKENPSLQLNRSNALIKLNCNLNFEKLTGNQIQNIEFNQTQEQKPTLHEYNDEFKNINYVNTYSSFIYSIISNDLRLTNSLLKFAQKTKYLLQSEEYVKIDIFPDVTDKTKLITLFNDEKIHANLSYYDQAINYFCQ